MSIWIFVKDLSSGVENLPIIKESTQASLRAQKKIQYTKVGREVVYKKEWIEAYLESNIRKAKAIKK